MTSETGTYRTTTLTGEAVRAFMPHPLPPANPPLALDAPLGAALTVASAAHVGGPLPAGYPRFAYAGAWGYESGPWGQDPNEVASPGPLVLYGANPDLPPITLLHVGERWYQPGIGRFIQRDPIGLKGGLNTYVYLSSIPCSDVDPLGLAGALWPPIVDWIGAAAFGSAGAALGAPVGFVGAGVGGGAGVGVWFALKNGVECVGDWFDYNRQAAEVDKKTERDQERMRKQDPKLFPPPPPPPPPEPPFPNPCPWC